MNFNSVMRTHPTSGAIPWGSIVAIFVVGAVALFLGAALALGVKLVTVAAFIVAISPILLFVLGVSEIGWIFVFSLFYGVGALISFASIPQALWVPYVLGILLVFKWMQHSYGNRVIRDSKANSCYSGFAIFSFILVYFISAILNWDDFIQFLVSFRTYVLPWLVVPFFVYWLTIDNSKNVQRLATFLMWTSVLQLPLVIYQNFFLMRRGLGTWDAMVGTFGGNPMTGGASHTMAIFVCLCVGGSIIFRNCKLISGRLMYLVLFSAIAVISLSEVKAALLLLPITVVVSVVAVARRKILAGTLSAAVAALLFVTIFVVYSVTFFSNDVRNTGGILDRLERVTQSERSNDIFVNRATGELTRTGALRVWRDSASNAPLPNQAFGDGPGGTRRSVAFGDGQIAKRVPFLLDMTAASLLLWEVGVIGLVTFHCIFLAMIADSLALLKARTISAEQQAILKFVVLGAVLTLVSIFYTRESLYYPGFQFLISVLVSALVYVRRSVGSPK